MNTSSEYIVCLNELKYKTERVVVEYLPRLHEALHSDQRHLSHNEIVNKIREDWISTTVEMAGRITSENDLEEENSIFAQILEFNFTVQDIDHIRKYERDLDIRDFLKILNKNCLRQKDKEWKKYRIDERLEREEVDLGEVGSKRIQFCKDCGEPIIVSTPASLKNLNQGSIGNK